MRATRIGLALGLATAAACAEPPGEPVGTFQVTYALEQNQCGQGAVYTLDGSVFSVELREDGGQGWWRPADGQPVVGTYEDGAFRFTVEKLIQLLAPDPGLAAGFPGCRVVQTELLEGEVAGEAIEGEHRLTLTATSDSECSPVMVASGGPFQALPCDIFYTYEGVTREEF